MIEVNSNLHAACTIYANKLPNTATRTSPVPSQDELPAFNSLGCNVYDLESLAGDPGGYLLQLDYPLASSQCIATILPFGYVVTQTEIVTAAIGPTFMAHLDDTWKLILNIDSCTGRAGPIHVSLWNFDSPGGSIKPMEDPPPSAPIDL